MEEPRFGDLLQRALGGEPLELPHSSARHAASFLESCRGSARAAPVITWEIFAGARSGGRDEETRVVRNRFLGLMSQVADLLGEATSEEAVQITAWTVLAAMAEAHTAASQAPIVADPQLDASIRSRRRADRLSSLLRMRITPGEWLTLAAAAVPLLQWREAHGITPAITLDSTGADAGAASSSAASASAPRPLLRPLRAVALGARPTAASAPAHAAAAPLDTHLAAFSPLATMLRLTAEADVAALSTAAASAAASAAVPMGAGAGAATSPRSSGPGAAAPSLLGEVDALWLYTQCEQFLVLSAARGASSGAWQVHATPAALGVALLELMQRYKGDSEAESTRLQTGLFEMLGEEGFDLMLQLMEARAAVSSIQLQEYKRLASALEAGADAAAAAAAAAAASKAAPFARRGAQIGPGVSVSSLADVKAMKELRRAERRADRARQALAALAARREGALRAGDPLEASGFAPDYLALERCLGLSDAAAVDELQAAYGGRGIGGAARGGFTSDDSHLITADEIIGAVGAGYGGVPKRLLPEGTTEVTKEGYKEVVVPAARPPPPPSGGVQLVATSQLGPLSQRAFAGIKSLNRLQSELFPAAYSSNENLLVCAPTGAGKTNVAMLTVCHELEKHVSADGRVRAEEFKIVYVAPMKALAQEVVAKFSERLSGLGITVKELTGDTQLSRKEIAETQIIVTTPEKWDVITRKGGENALVSEVKLLIIDEVHLLADDRGAVIESIVARTLRLVESSQSVIRIVGLSATLPNYKDVAVFLKVDPKRGLFYFDAGYRPVPLQQTFVGITENNAIKRANYMNKITFEKAIAAIRRGKQVMVFVHSRKDTAKTARALLDLAREEGVTGLLSPFSDAAVLDGAEEATPTSFYEGPDATLEARGSEQAGAAPEGGAGAPTAPAGGRKGKGSSGSSTIQGEGRVSLSEMQWVQMQREVEKSRNQDLKELFPEGFGIHHAGMLRSDRGLSERMFAAGVIKILVCTATLAWGVNLPAHTVIIKGTQIYNAEGGGFTDVGILDVMQIFGRAGRPQFDTSGEGIIVTTHDKLQLYLRMITQSVPIESSFIKALPDHLNAEIAGGTVTSLRDAIVWMSYTYLYVRMVKNPTAYGIGWEERERDPTLHAKRLALVTDAAKRLDQCHMIRFDPSSGNLAITDLGRTASHYYISAESIQTFNRVLDVDAALTCHAPVLTDAELLDLVCRADEFKNLKVREEELIELDSLKARMHVKSKGDVTNTHVKVNVLMQAFISGLAPRGFTLISDTAYITQSAGRIARALFEIFLRKGWSSLAMRMLDVAKALDKRLWWDANPLWQVRDWLLPAETIRKLDDTRISFEALYDMSPADLGSLVRSPAAGQRVYNVLQSMPYVHVEASMQPITGTIVRVTLKLYPQFEWSDRMHGTGEPWWVWVEDGDSERIFHCEPLQLSKRQVVSGEEIVLQFAIPVFMPLPQQYWVRVISDRWIGLETVVPLSFRGVVMPESSTPHTTLLDLNPLPVSALKSKAFEGLYAGKFSHFNPVQTQVFHTLYHTDENVLLGAPTGSGKTIVAELALFRLLNAHPGAKCVYVAPLKALVSERLKDWRVKLGAGLTKGGAYPRKLNVVELTGDVTPDSQVLKAADVIITTPEKWDSISRNWRRRGYVQSVGLVIIDEIHLLGEDRGPVLEVIVSRMRYVSERTDKPVRFVGLSTAMANAKDLADWLGVGRGGLFNFKPAVRPVPMTVHIQGFPGKHYCPRMATMNKPAYTAVTTYSPDKPALIFVSSRRQTRLTALELIALCTLDENPKRFLRMPEDEMAAIAARVDDPALQHTLMFGVGIHHAGLSESDRAVVEELFVAVKIQILVCTSTLAWGVNFPAHLVVVKGTEFFDAKSQRYVDFPVTDVLQMMGRAGRPQFDNEGVAVILVHEPKKNFYRKFLYEPFPVESHLKDQLADHINAEIAGGAIISRRDAVEYLTWTYFFRRLLQNPGFYGLEDTTTEGVRKYLYAIVAEVVKELVASGCIVTGSDAVELLSDAVGAPHVEVDGGAGGEAVPPPAQALAPTVLGKVCSIYYLHHQSIRLFRDHIGPDDSYDHLMRLLCDAHEFAELPVRHNEDGLNEQLAKDVPWPCKPRLRPTSCPEDPVLATPPPAPAPAPTGGATGGAGEASADAAEDAPRTLPCIGLPRASGLGNVDWLSPHVKALLLLQARMARRALPIPDYVTDTKTVLDNTLRVLYAMTDIAADAGYLATTLRLMRLVQAVVQARMPDEDPLCQLPRVVDAAAAKALVEAARLRGTSAGAIPSFVPDPYTGLAALSPARLGALTSLPEGALASTLRAAVSAIADSSGLSASPAQAVNDLTRVLRAIPAEFSVQASVVPGTGVSLSAPGALPVVAPGHDFVVRVAATAPAGSDATRSVKGYTPAFARGKEWGWWLVVGDASPSAPAGGELAAMKRLARLGVAGASGGQHDMLVAAPEEPGRYSWTVALISDVMLGLDAVATFEFVVAA